jgi:hypothetical protein
LTGAPVAATRRAPAGRPRRRRRAVRPRLALAAGFAAAAIALFACYLCQSRTIPVGSDGASQALQAWDLLHGNLLLHGWWVTDVSFYTTELPQYGLIELARGLGADVIHVAGAMTYTLLVLAAALLARGRTAGPAGIARALVAAGVMLAPSLGPGTQTLLLSPDHTGTGVPLLLLFLLIDRGLADRRLADRRLADRGLADRRLAGGLAGRGRRAAAARWGVPLLAGLGLAATALADALTVFVAVIPLVLVGSLRLAGAARDGGWRPALAARREEAALVGAAVLAVPAELAAAALIRAHGGWQVNGLRTALASTGQLAGHARLAGEGLLELFGADVFAASGLAGTALAAVHLAGFALAVTGIVATVRQLGRGTDLVEQVLLTGIVIDLAAYVAGVQAVNILSTREIAPVLPFAAVLAGRRLGGRLTVSTVSTVSTARTTARTAATAALGVVLALYGAGLGYAAAQPAAAPQYAGLASWLRTHHLTHGLSGYHQANIVTLAAGGRVTLRAVTAGRDGRLAAYTWNASAAWYDPARQAATFLVLTVPGAPPAAGSAGLTAQQAAATFGRPARSYRYQAYLILVWPRGENLLARLRTSQSGDAPGSNKG